VRADVLVPALLPLGDGSQLLLLKENAKKKGVTSTFLTKPESYI